MDAKPDVLLLVEFDHQLGRVERALVRVPFHEVLEALLILQNGAKAAKTDPFERVIAILSISELKYFRDVRVLSNISR